ncbi:MAG: prepilin-type N-terminal cleavage/methylation domain-containing protein [Candidatus Omnitrophica bacterium]|nr:prepilin-type N-terminal cleavage/methylation domain-containing protein [Candidatus Omnitrophota bacterium]
MLQRVYPVFSARLNDLPHQERARRGFTLIELLIVIAIILILIAIALPNFLEAQIRARVTKAKGEIRSLKIAMESYNLDFKVYPAESEDNCLANEGRPRTSCGLTWLTSPIKYLAAVPEDPFPGVDVRLPSFEMGGVECGPKCFGRIDRLPTLVLWAIYTRGPDTPKEEIRSSDPHESPYDNVSIETYNPTNGTKSEGDIFQYGGDSRFIGTTAGNAGLNPDDPARRNGQGLLIDGNYYYRKMPPGVSN